MSDFGSLWNSRRIAAVIRPMPLPIERASRSLANTAASSPTAIARTTTPTIAAVINAELLCPVITRMAIESTGNASFTKMFQIPVTPTYSATFVPVNPQECRIS